MYWPDQNHFWIAMRAEIIRCDTCAKEHDATYKLPIDWIETKQRDGFDNEEEHHYCSIVCLATWAIPDSVFNHVDNCVRVLDSSLGLLDPKKALGGPAPTFEQMQILETVKDDYTKLKDAIGSLRKRGRDGQ